MGSDTSLTVVANVNHMKPYTDEERRRWIIARSEYHEQLAKQLRRLLARLEDDSANLPELEPERRAATRVR